MGLRKKILYGIRLNVLALGLVSLLTDISSEMILPLLPLFIVGVLGANQAALGLIEGVAQSAASLMNAISGRLSDAIGKRKPLVLAGYTLSAMSKPFFALSQIWEQALIVRFLDRIGKGVRDSPRDAMLAESSERVVWGKVFGIQRAMDTAGAVIGPILAIGLLALLGGMAVGDAYRTIFLLATIPAALAVLVVIFFVRETKGYPEYCKESTGALSHKFKLFIAIATLFALGEFSYAFFILKAVEMGVPVIYTVALYVLFNIFYMCFSIPVGMLADRFGRRRVLTLGYALFGITCLGFGFAGNALLLAPLFIGYGIASSIIKSIDRAYVSELVPRCARGGGLGVFHTATGVAALPASFIAGSLWQSFGSQATFLYGAVIALVATLALHYLMKKHKASWISH